MRYVKNTKDIGNISFLFFEEKKRFVGVCLEFNIVEEGKTYEEVKKNLETATDLHLKAVQENKLSDDLLNRHAPKEYWEMYEEAQKRERRSRMLSAFKRRRLFSASINTYAKSREPEHSFG